MNVENYDKIAAAYDLVQGDFGDAKKASLVYPMIKEMLQALGARTAMDVGCGNGAFLRFCRRDEISVDGLDRSRMLVQRAQARDAALGLSARHYVADAQSPLAGIKAELEAEYDAATYIFSLQDIEDVGSTLRHVRSLLKPRSSCIVVNESYFALTSTRIKHTVPRLLTRSDSSDHGANFISRAEWGRGQFGYTYCRPDQYYVDLARSIGRITSMKYFGRSQNTFPLQRLHMIYPPLRPFFCLTIDCN